MTPDEQIKQALDDIAKIEQASQEVSNAMINGTQEDFDRALQQGIQTLEEMEEKRGGTDL